MHSAGALWGVLMPFYFGSLVGGSVIASKSKSPYPSQSFNLFYKLAHRNAVHMNSCPGVDSDGSRWFGDRLVDSLGHSVPPGD